MVESVPTGLAALVAGSELAVLALAVVGCLYWLRLRDKREAASPERQRERLRREYWGQV